MTALVDGLRNFGLMLKDIAGITTDAASSMIRLGSLLQEAVAPQPFYTQTCLAHALHLACLDSLSSEPFDDAHYRVDEIADEERQAYNCGDGTSDVLDDDLPSFEGSSLSGPYGSIVDRIRAVCHHFAKSTTSHGSLLGMRRQQQKKELRVLLSCPIRWNSILHMLQRFVELKPQMQVIYQRQKNSFPIRAADEPKIKDMISSLALIETAVEMMSAEGATVLDAEHILQVR